MNGLTFLPPCKTLQDVINTHSPQIDGCCYLSDVGEESEDWFAFVEEGKWIQLQVAYSTPTTFNPATLDTICIKLNRIEELLEKVLNDSEITVVK